MLTPDIVGACSVVSDSCCQASLSTGILQVRILEWVAISSSRGSFWPRDQTHVFCVSRIDGRILYHWATWEVPEISRRQDKSSKKCINVDRETRNRLRSLSFSGCVGLDPGFMFLTCQTTPSGQWHCFWLHILASSFTGVSNSIHWGLTGTLHVLSHLVCVVDDGVLMLQDW